MTDCQFLRILVDNKQKDTKHNSQNARKYHCINKNTCLLNGNCFLKNILCIATTKSDKKNCEPKNYKNRIMKFLSY